MKPTTGSTLRWSLAALLGCAACNALALHSPQSHRFVLSGSGSLTLDTPTLSRGQLQLKAMLSASVTPPPAPTIQSSSRFALSGTLAAASLVCYNDTIFRDDYDGDGF